MFAARSWWLKPGYVIYNRHMVMFTILQLILCNLNPMFLLNPCIIRQNKTTNKFSSPVLIYSTVIAIAATRHENAVVHRRRVHSP